MITEEYEQLEDYWNRQLIVNTNTGSLKLGLSIAEHDKKLVGPFSSFGELVMNLSFKLWMQGYDPELVKDDVVAAIRDQSNHSFHIYKEVME